jgi:hypothetical protein
VLGDSVDWSVGDYLLARIAHILAGANWQRSGGKGPKPKPIKVPDGRRRSQKSRAERGADTARRLRNLGLLPGHQKPPPRPLTVAEQALAAAIERAKANPAPPAPEPSPAELQQRIDKLAGLH